MSSSPVRTAYALGVRFRALVELGGKTATGIEIPPVVVEALGTSKRPAVRVRVGDHAYRTTVASMGGRFLVPLNAENRAAAGLRAGDQVQVDIEIDDEPRTVVVPSDLAEALGQEPKTQAFFRRARLHPSQGVGALG